MNINTLLTDFGNGSTVTQSQRKFLEDCLTIHEQFGRPFSWYDFPNMSGTNFRQMILKLHPFIELAYRSRPCYYRIRGTPFKQPFAKITHKPTGDDMIRILSQLKEQPPKVHDFKMKLGSNLHKYLIMNGKQPNPNNKGFVLKFNLGDQVIAKTSIYPQTIQVDIACTSNPLIYDITGVVHLTFLLGKLLTLLELINPHAMFSPLGEWIVTHYHFGKDVTENYSKQAYHLTYDEVSTGLIRFYSKSAKNGLTIHRIEQIQTPNTTFKKEIDNMISNQISVY